MDMDFIIDEDLIDKTYMYCYKRLNNSADAEDLAQDILLEALKTIRGGKDIHSFYSWYWKMAHNRYCMCLTKKQNHAVSLEVYGGEVMSDIEIADDIIKADEINELNYAISRLSSIHRNVIVLYYLKEYSIKEIADMLAVPVGTVKRRLFDAKSNIKKGMGEMSNIGKTSYAPASLDLWGGNQIPNYWDSISDIMTKQIFVTCYKSAKSIKEIADEIGVAPVYFEEKINYLLKNRFLKESGTGKYLTDFCIINKQADVDFLYEKSIIYSEVGKELTDIIREVEPEIREFDFYNEHISYEKLMWILYVYACSSLSELMLKTYESMKWDGKLGDNKNNRKNYDICGNVTYPDQKITLKTDNYKIKSWSNMHFHFQTPNYKHVTFANLYEKYPFSDDRDKVLNDSNINLFMKIYDSGEVTLTKVEEEQVAILIQKQIVSKKNGKLIPNIPVMSYEEKDKLHALLQSKLGGLSIKYVERLSEIGERILRPEIREDLLDQFVHTVMSTSAFFPLSHVLYYIMEEGKTVELPQDNDYENSSAALCIYYKL